MTSRQLAMFVALLLGLVVHCPAGAQDRPGNGQEKTKQDVLERRIAKLEVHIDDLAKELQILRLELKAPAVSLQPAGKTTIRIFTLKYTKAPAIAKALQDLLQGKGGATVRIVSEPSTNCLLVVGSSEEFDVVEAVVIRLEAVAKEQIGSQVKGR
jgi:hypothetical protein